ncbi:MAG TPA: TolC family protein [Bacteroidia bacterium]|nr:TolC family protein [Bacteroidia bacterium]
MKKIVHTIILLLLVQLVYAQNSIDNILSSVAKNNKTIISSTQFVEARKLEYKTGLTPENPTVEYDYLVGSPVGAGNQTDFSVTQAFDFPTAYFSKKAMAKEQIAKTELELISLRQEILLETKTTCFTLIYLNKKQVELKRRVSEINQVYESYQKKLKNGEATILNINKAQLMLLNINTDLQLNESEIKRTNSILTELNGGQAITLTDTNYPLVIDLPDFTKMDSIIEANDLLVKIYSKDKDVSSAKLKVVKNFALPKMEAGYHSQAILGQKYQGAHIGISIPLWENKNSIKTEKANLLYTDTRIAEHRTEHFYENQQLYEKYAVLKSTLSEYKKIFGANNNLELLNKSLTSGNISSIEYFMELSYFYGAYDNFLKTENEYNQIVAMLYKYQL